MTEPSRNCCFSGLYRPSFSITGHINCVRMRLHDASLLTSALCLHNLAAAVFGNVPIPVVTSPTENIRFFVSILASVPGSVKENIKKNIKNFSAESDMRDRDSVRNRVIWNTVRVPEKQPGKAKGEICRKICYNYKCCICRICRHVPDCFRAE